MGGEGGTASQVERLYAVAQALTSALTPEEVAAAVFEHALADLGAGTAGLWMLRGPVIRFAGGAGHVDDSPYRVGEILLESDLPAAISVRTGEAVTCGSRLERDSRWPSLEGFGPETEAVAVVPLKTGERAFGCLHIGYRTAMPVADMEVPLLQRLAELCSAALQRSELYEDEREEREQLQFFSDATRALIWSLDPDEVIDALVDTAVPRLAPWCAMLVPEGNQLRTVAVRIAGDDGTHARAIERHSFPLAADMHISRSFRTGRMEVANPAPAVVVAGQGVDIKAALIVPITWGGGPIGVLCLGFDDPDRPLNARLQETAEGLALRAGVALHNASRYDTERSIARTLTEALLPPTVPTVGGYETAVRYLPASGDVAGDWYDLFEVGGKFVLGVGDSAGHGIPAATVMAELRNAARGLAATGLGPTEILDFLSLVCTWATQSSSTPTGS